MTQNELPEAPASVTYSVISPKGYPALVTYRSTTVKELLENMTMLEAKFEKDGYKPQVRGGYQKKEIEYIEGKACPDCGARLIKKFRKDGREFHQCEHKKWNPIKNINEGTCNYTDWME